MYMGNGLGAAMIAPVGKFWSRILAPKVPEPAPATVPRLDLGTPILRSAPPPVFDLGTPFFKPLPFDLGLPEPFPRRVDIAAPVAPRMVTPTKAGAFPGLGALPPWAIPALIGVAVIVLATTAGPKRKAA